VFGFKCDCCLSLFGTVIFDKPKLNRFNSGRASLQQVEKRNGSASRKDVAIANKMSPANLTNPSPQLSVVLQWYKAVTAWKFEVLEELFSDDYIHKTLPASANEQPKNKAEGIAHAKAVGALFGYKPLQVCCVFVASFMAGWWF
jgi:hypothetical protein